MTTPALEAHGLVAGYRPDLPILHGVSANVLAGEVVTIVGPNGAGKSTFIKAIAGLVQVTAGRVLVGGTEHTGLATHRLIAAGIGYVPQTNNVFSTLTIEENLAIGAYALRGDAAPRIERAYAAFPDLAAARRAKAYTLSGGQRQMLATARALLAEPQVILLDEPTAGLAPMVVQAVFERIRALADDGVAVLMVEQNARAALGVSDRGYVFAEGRNRVEGKAAELLEDPEVVDAFLGGRAPLTGGAA